MAKSRRGGKGESFSNAATVAMPTGEIQPQVFNVSEFEQRMKDLHTSLVVDTGWFEGLGGDAETSSDALREAEKTLASATKLFMKYRKIPAEGVSSQTRKEALESQIRRTGVTMDRIRSKMKERVKELSKVSSAQSASPVAEPATPEPLTTLFPEPELDAGVDTSGVDAMKQVIEGNRHRTQDELNQTNPDQPPPVVAEPFTLTDTYQTSSYGRKTDSLKREMQEFFPAGETPPDVWQKLLALTDEHRRNFVAGDADAMRETEGEIDAFMNEQSMAARARVDADAAPGPAQAGEKTRAPELIPLNELKGILRAQLEGNKKIESVNDIGLAVQDNGLQLHIDINVPQGNAILDGLVVIEEGKPVFKDRNASTYPFLGKSKVEAAFADLGAEIQKHFDAHYGQPVYIQVGEEGLSIEFAPPVTAEPAKEPDIDDMAANPDDAPDEIRDALDKDATRAENRSKFFEVMKKAGEKFGWYKSSSEELIRRNEELDAQGEKIGGLDGERLFRKMGEKYNKMPFWSKLVVGGALGTGAVVGASASMPLAFACMSGIAAQRLAGFATMYMKFEKKSHDEKWGKEKAMLKAGFYTVAMGLTMKEAIEYASDTSAAHWAQAKVEGWLGAMMPGHESAPPSEPSKSVTAPKGIPDAPQPAPAPEAPASPTAAAAAAGTAAPEIVAPPAPASAASEAATAAPAPEMPEISVEATKGRGYEYMMKRVWEQLQDKDLDPNDYPEGSDIRTLLEADAQSVDKVVHQIAADPKHNFFRTDGTSVQIDKGAQMAFGARGELHLSTEKYDYTFAPAHAPTTAPEASSTAAASDAAAVPDSLRGVSPSDYAPVPETDAGIISTQGQGEGQGGAGGAGAGGGDIPESHAAPVEQSATSIPNKFGLSIPVGEPHIYDDGARHLLAYGGSPGEKMKMITDYLTKDKFAVIYAEDAQGARVPWFRDMDTGTIVHGPAMKTNGFLGIGSTLLKPPGPEDLKSLIK